MSKWFSSFIIHVNFKFNTEKISASLADITCNTHIHVAKYSDTYKYIHTSLYTNIFTLSVCTFKANLSKIAILVDVQNETKKDWSWIDLMLNYFGGENPVKSKK